MKILKFGGTSVGSAEKIKHLMEIINSDERQIIVLSAVAGTTNALEEMGAIRIKGHKGSGIGQLKELKAHYQELIQDLFSSEKAANKAKSFTEKCFGLIENLLNNEFGEAESKMILAQGELLSTHLVYYYLEEQGIVADLLPALDFMKTDDNNEPVLSYINYKLEELLNQKKDQKLFITQGYICRNDRGEIDNLRRGGSDYTASLIGAALQAKEIQIWTDIDGMHNNDPRIVANTRPIAHISFNEAAELAYFGAKILHPQSVLPAQKYNVPVRLLNTGNPGGSGTLISGNGVEKGIIKAVAAKDNITVINIHSTRMLMAYGFLTKVFEVFEKYKTPIDMITTSEVAVSITIDQEAHLDSIVEELADYGTVNVEKEQSIICVVGDFSSGTNGYAAAVLDSVKHLPLRMISYGGSDYNVSILLDEKHKKEALRSLHNRLF